MPGITNIDELIRSMRPMLKAGEFVFITVPHATYGAGAAMEPVASVKEDEGLSLVVPVEHARDARLAFDGVFRMITLGVHSSLSAVGLTAAVSHALFKAGISANVIAAFHHDHIFVPADRAEEALAALEALVAESS